MSSQDFHRHLTGSNAGAFDPHVAPFVPAPNMPTPSGGWHLQSGQGLQAGYQRYTNSGYHAVHAPQGMPRSFPVHSQGAQRFMQTSAGGTSTAMRPRVGGRHESKQSAHAQGGDADSDSSGNPSVGEPEPRLATDQLHTATISIFGKGPNKKSKPKQKKRPYLVPSKASGGVPNPTRAYIAQSAKAPSQLQVPRNILVIIDLNGTLLHRPNHKKTSTFIERPYTRTFLDYCLKTFTVAIWSSAKPDNVRKMVPQILSPQDQCKLVAVWGRDTLGLSSSDYNSRVQVYKRLESIWDDAQVRASHPEASEGKRWDQTNTVLIDDSKEKARSQPYNIIQLPEFEGDTLEPGYVLPQVHDYLNECAHQRDISTFIREKPFKFDPLFSLDLQDDGKSTLSKTPVT